MTDRYLVNVSEAEKAMMDLVLDQVIKESLGLVQSAKTIDEAAAYIETLKLIQSTQKAFLGAVLVTVTKP